MDSNSGILLVWGGAKERFRDSRQNSDLADHITLSCTRIIDSSGTLPPWHIVREGRGGGCPREIRGRSADLTGGRSSGGNVDKQGVSTEARKGWKNQRKGKMRRRILLRGKVTDPKSRKKMNCFKIDSIGKGPRGRQNIKLAA